MHKHNIQHIMALPLLVLHTNGDLVVFLCICSISKDSSRYLRVDIVTNCDLVVFLGIFNIYADYNIYLRVGITYQW